MGGKRIQKIIAREILDSRGNPTLEARVILKNGVSAVASVPSGASVGRHEALELRDNDKRRYQGQGVLKAVKNVNEKIARVLKGVKANGQQKIDQRMIELDGTKNKSKLGANAILAVSLACARVGAVSSRLPLYQYIRKLYGFNAPQLYSLPTPMFNIFNGGKHADTNLDFQEFMVIPVKKVKFSEKVRMGSEIFHELGKVLKTRGLDTDVGNEGGYAPDIDSAVDALDYIIEATEKAGYMPGKEVRLGLDVGASELYNKKRKKYIFHLDDSELTSDQLISLYQDWLGEYPIVLIEDGLAGDEWLAWKRMTKELIKANKKLLLVGDDLFVTNDERLRKGIDLGVANAVIIKPNQVGTLSETIKCVKLARQAAYKIIVSHRSGETTDDFIADLAVACGADYIKAGSLSRGERVSKYNRLMEIEEEI